MSWSDTRWSGSAPGVLDDPWRTRPHPPRAAAPQRAASARAGLRVDLDAAFATVMFLTMLFASQLGTLSAAMLILMVPAYAAFRRARLWAVLAPRWLLLVPVAVAGASVFWSQAPGESAKFAVEYAITALGGLLLAGAKHPHNVLRGLFAAFVLYVTVALALGQTVAVGNEGGAAFSGLTQGKNLLGDIAASGLLVSLGVLVTSFQRRRWPWAVAAAAGAAMTAYALVASRSAGALMGVSFGVVAMLALLAVVRAGVAVRTVLFGFLGLCLTLALIFHRWLATQLIQLGSDLFDKDATLTGRTYLWYRAQDLIEQRPLLGHGFQAFWLQGNTDAEGLWRYAGITTRSGFTFHNTLIELLVQMGWVGVGLIGAAVAVVLWLLVVRCIKAPTLSLCVWMGVLFYVLVRTPVEAIGLAPLYFSTVLTFMALGFALGRPSQRAPRAARRPVMVPTVRVVSARVLDPQPGARRLLAPPRSSDVGRT